MNDLDQATLEALLDARDALVDAMVRLNPRPSKIGDERRRIYQGAHAKVDAAIARLRRERP